MGTLSEAERQALSEAKIATFEDRIILEAQPPIDDEVLQAIGRKCAGPLPHDLIALWRTAFGGTLEYDVRANFKDHEASFSFSELFFPNSDGYLDLWGWINHEEELAKEAAAQRGVAWPGALDALPFGGFEYTDRLYAIVRPGSDHGSVCGWMQGLPPAWIFSLHTDSVARMADGVRAFFRTLVLEADPDTGDENATGVRMLEALDDLATLGAAGRSAAGKLRDLVHRVVLDWRSAVVDGSILTNGVLRRLGLEHAARNDDIELLGRLASLGCDLSEALRGGAGALDHALTSGALRAARFLLDRGVPTTGALRAGAHAVDLELARELLARGATVDEHTIFAAVDAGRVDTALLMYEAVGSVRSLQLAIRARERAAEAEQTAKRIEIGALISNISAAEYRAKAARLKDLADRVDPTLRR